MIQLAVDNPKPQGRRKPYRRYDDNAPIILPAINLWIRGEGHKRKWEWECEMLGMTSAQRNMAWKAYCRSGPVTERAEAYGHAIQRTFELWMALEYALECERREVLAILMEHHPWTARRIMKSYARNGRSKST